MRLPGVKALRSPSPGLLRARGKMGILLRARHLSPVRGRLGSPLPGLIPFIGQETVTTLPPSGARLLPSLPFRAQVLSVEAGEIHLTEEQSEDA